MAIERLWLAVSAQLITSNGGQSGEISVPSTIGIKVKQRVQIFSGTQPIRELEVKQVINETDLLLGEIGPEMKKYANLTLFLTSDNASLMAPTQARNPIVPDAFWRAVYEEEPTVAIRTFPVDHLGRRYTTDNPFPVQLSDGSINIGTVNAELEVQLSHKDNDPNSGDVHDSIRIGNGITEVDVTTEGELKTLDSQNLEEAEALHETIQNEFDETQQIIEDEAQTTRDLLQSEFDETQTILQNEFDQTQTLLQSEFDQTQQTIEDEAQTTRDLLQLEFDETQTKIDDLTTVVQDEFDETQTILQSEFDETQQVIEDELQTTRDLLQLELDETQAKLQDIYVRQSNKIQSIINSSKWMDLAVFDEVTPSFSLDGKTVTITYKSSGAILGEAVAYFNTEQDWSLNLYRYIADDDGTKLLDDDGTALILD